MKMKLLIVLFAALFSVVGIPSAVLAEECPDRTETTLATNGKFLEDGTKLAEEALEHAKQGHADETRASAKASLEALKCIVSSQAGSQLQSPKGKIRLAYIKAGKGEMDQAVELLEAGVAKLQKVKQL
jgi:predicted negative regulator of RcsB-dependent stress response